MTIKSEIYKGYRIEVKYQPSTNAYSFWIYYKTENPDCYPGWNTMDIAFDVAREVLDWLTDPNRVDPEYQDYREFPDFQG